MTRSKDNFDLMKQIDENLRRVYREAETEDVPPRFAALLDKLRQQDQPNE